MVDIRGGKDKPWEVMGTKSKSLLSGAGSVLAVFSNDRSERPVLRPVRTDSAALRGDWAKLGQDMGKAIARAATAPKASS